MNCVCFVTEEWFLSRPCCLSVNGVMRRCQSLPPGQKSYVEIKPKLGKSQKNRKKNCPGNGTKLWKSRDLITRIRYTPSFRDLGWWPWIDSMHGRRTAVTHLTGYC